MLEIRRGYTRRLLPYYIQCRPVRHTVRRHMFHTFFIRIRIQIIHTFPVTAEQFQYTIHIDKRSICNHVRFLTAPRIYAGHPFQPGMEWILHMIMLVFEYDLLIDSS